jgi:GLPGLI family protein
MIRSIVHYTFLLLLFISIKTSAQNTIFLTQGRIEFEKKLNLHAQMDAMFDEGDESWKELQKKTMPKFKTTYFDLYFHGNKTLYKPGRENTDNNKLWQQPAEDNVIYDELDKSESTAQKNVFEQLFLVKDSTRAIRWKITDETRTIAGFDCRRANAMIMDSVYVVAFYTDAIVTPGGPESFTGLPGMILGIALPHEHVTWFATKVYAEDVKEESLKAPVKGKKVNNKELLQTMNQSLKDWGKYGKLYIWASML